MSLPPSISHEEIKAAARRLREGGIVAFPTETVYGLGADAFNSAAIESVYRLKGRPANNPLIVHVTGPDMARRVVHTWTPQAETLARAFWPGPLTIVLPKAAVLPDPVTAGGPTVGVRSPDHPIALALLFEFGGPIIGPSANLSGGVSPTLAHHVHSAFAAHQVLTLDGGPCRVGIESTVIDLSSPQPRILRPGIIGAEDLAAALGIAVLNHRGSEESPERELGVHAPATNGALPSPGLLAVHYAPHTRAILVDEDELEDLLEDAADSGDRIAVISHRFATSVDAPHTLIRLPGLAAPYAAAIYEALREADAHGASLIAIELPPTSAELPADTAIWQAVADRLSRATTR